MICTDCPIGKKCGYFGASPLEPSLDGKTKIECTLQRQVQTDAGVLSIIHVPVWFEVDATTGKVLTVTMDVYTHFERKRLFGKW